MILLRADTEKISAYSMKKLLQKHKTTEPNQSKSNIFFVETGEPSEQRTKRIKVTNSVESSFETIPGHINKISVF